MIHINYRYMYALAILTFITGGSYFLPNHLCAPKNAQCKNYRITLNRINNVENLIRKKFDYRYLSIKKPEKFILDTLSPDEIKDQWANKFIFTIKENKINVYSVGINGRDDHGLQDDITANSNNSLNLYCAE